jgi:DNA-binding NarL/FixJ family response regulator
MKQASSSVVFIHPSAAQSLFGDTRTWPVQPVVSTSPAAAPLAQLTPRQLEVLALLCEGLPNKLICRRLNIATGTVKVHISCILRELGVRSRLQAVVVGRSLIGAATSNATAQRNVSAGASAY